MHNWAASKWSCLYTIRWESLLQVLDFFKNAFSLNESFIVVVFPEESLVPRRWRLDLVFPHVRPEPPPLPQMLFSFDVLIFIHSGHNVKKRRANECNCNSNAQMAIMKTYKNICILEGQRGSYNIRDAWGLSHIRCVPFSFPPSFSLLCFYDHPLSTSHSLQEHFFNHFHYFCYAFQRSECLNLGGLRFLFTLLSLTFFQQQCC